MKTSNFTWPNQYDTEQAREALHDTLAHIMRYQPDNRVNANPRLSIQQIGV